MHWYFRNFDVSNSEFIFWKFFLDPFDQKFWGKEFSLYYAARGQTPVTNEGKYCTLSRALVSSTLFEQFFSYLEHRVPSLWLKSKISFSGVCQMLSKQLMDPKIDRKLSLTDLVMVRKALGNHKIFHNIFFRKTEEGSQICTLNKIRLTFTLLWPFDMTISMTGW